MSKKNILTLDDRNYDVQSNIPCCEYCKESDWDYDGIMFCTVSFEPVNPLGKCDVFSQDFDAHYYSKPT